MKKGLRIGYSRLNHPKNYYRSGLTVELVRLAMSEQGWLSVTQVMGALNERIPPEAKARFAQFKAYNKRTVEENVQFGFRELIRNKLQRLQFEGKVEKHGSGKDAKYRWIETENDSTRKDKARRRHTKSSGAKPGSNP